MFRLQVEATGGVTITSPGIMIQTEGPAIKAIQMHGYGGVDQLRYEDALSPTVGPGEVLVKIAATSVNPIDWKTRRGNMRGMMTLQFPVIPGRDVAGEVVAVGADVKQPVPIARLGQFWDSAVVTLRDIK